MCLNGSCVKYKTMCQVWDDGVSLRVGGDWGGD